MEDEYHGLWVTHNEKDHPQWEERKEIMKSISSKRKNLVQIENLLITPNNQLKLMRTIKKLLTCHKKLSTQELISLFSKVMDDIQPTFSLTVSTHSPNPSVQYSLTQGVTREDKFP